MFNITSGHDLGTEPKEIQRNAEIRELKNDVELLLKQAILEKAEAEDMKTILQVLLSILNSNPTNRLSCFNWLDTILEKVSQLFNFSKSF